MMNTSLGWKIHMTSGSAIPSRPYITYSLIHNSRKRWTSDCTGNMMCNWRIGVFKISCQGIGPGTNQYVWFFCVFTLVVIQVLYLDIIAHDNPECEGAALVPVILGSNKTTISIATSQHDYYPLYLSLGNLHNCTQWSHRKGVALIGFLAIQKSKFIRQLQDYYKLYKLFMLLATHEAAKTANFRKFHCQLFHVTLLHILQVLKPYLEHWEVVWCSDGWNNQ